MTTYIPYWWTFFWPSNRIGALMVLHKLASGPGTYDLATVLCLSEGVRRRPGYLRVHAIRGRGLPNADDYSAMDPYVKIEMTTPHQPNMETGQDNKEEGKTKPALEAGMHPTWNVVEHKIQNRLLHIHVSILRYSVHNRQNPRLHVLEVAVATKVLALFHVDKLVLVHGLGCETLQRNGGKIPEASPSKFC